MKRILLAMICAAALMSVSTPAMAGRYRGVGVYVAPYRPYYSAYRPYYGPAYYPGYYPAPVYPAPVYPVYPAPAYPAPGVGVGYYSPGFSFGVGY